jgi:integral membrane sensor domain MASE1
MRGERGKRLVTKGEVFLIALYFLVALTSIALTRNSVGSSLLWPANAITAAFLVRLPAVRWGRIFLGVLCAGTLANVLGAHDAPLGSLAMAAVDLLEVGSTACLFRFYARLPFPNITVVSGVRMLAFIGIGIPAVAALPDRDRGACGAALCGARRHYAFTDRHGVGRRGSRACHARASF